MKKLIFILTVAVMLSQVSPSEPATLEVVPPGGVTVLGDVWTSIQAAVNAAGEGDTILIHDGTYTEQVTITDKGLTLTGETENAVIIQADTSQTGAGNVFTINAAGKNVTISNMTIRHGDYGIRSSAGNVNVLHCTVYHNGWDGTGLPNPETDPQSAFVTFWATYATDGGAIRIQTSAASEIAHCTIYENDRGIRFQDGDNGDIHDNVSHDNIESGIYLAASSYSGATGCTNTDVNDNESYGNMNNGILSIGGHTNTIRNNDVYDNWTSGIAANYPSEVTIQGNTINNNNVYGFTGEGTQGENHGGIFLSGDTAVTSRTFTAKILSNTISNNNSGTGTDAEGMRITSSVYSDGIEVSNNTFVAHDIDILIQSQAATTIVKENCFDGPPVAVGIQNDDAAVLDATLNAWGDPSGPYHPVKNAAGTGHSVSDNVDIYPWYLDCAMSTPADLPVHNVTQNLYYNTIQDAIDAANADDQIVVAAGTFVEQLEITIPLTITGAGQGSTIVQSPDNLTLFYTTSADNYPIVYLHDVIDVNISELTIDGAGKGNANTRFNGIAFRNAGGTIQNVTVINVMDTPFSGAQHGVAIYALNNDGTDRDINILNCTISDFQKTAIALSGANAVCTVEDCNVTGAGDTTVTAQNGIQYGYGAGGTIKGNTVSDIRYTGPDWSATGILGYGDGGSAAINVQGNTVTNTQGALQIYFFNGDVNVAGNNLSGNDFSFLYAFDSASVTGNTFDNGSEQGLYLADVTNITASDNTFNDCKVGLVVDGASDTLTFTDCQFNNNTDIGIAVVPYDTDNPDNVSIQCCQIAGNTNYGLQNTSSNLVDATHNWWGDASGPSGAGGGSGDAVSTNVTFFPWLLSTDCEDTTVEFADFVVDDNWVGLPDWTTVDVEGTDYYIGLNAFDTIQKAVDAASDGNTVKVRDGTYDEAVTIDKANLVLRSMSTPIIKPSTTPTNSFQAAVYIAADGVTVDGFEIDGTTVCDNCILGWETSGLTIKNNVIHGAVHGWDGCGILLFSWGNGGTVYGNLIQNNEVYDTGRMGIMVMDHGSTYSVTSDNVITGNIVYDTWQVGWGDHGGAIQINVAKNCEISNNVIHDANDNRGIYMFGSASGNKIIANTITNNPIGIQLWISGEGGESIDWLSETPTSPMVIGNNITGNNTGAISTNIAGPNMVMDAEYNFWGDVSGPNDPCGISETDGATCYDVSTIKNADGLGDAVSENVDYCPWLIVPAAASDSLCPRGDLDGDCDVDFNDLAILANNWLVGTEP